MIFLKDIRIVILLAATVLVATPSFADGHDRHGSNWRWEDRHDYHYHDHPMFGFRFSFIPSGCVSIRLGGLRYYYGDGLYYQWINGEYVLVQPPIGVMVRRIPSDYRPMIINGVTYYTDSGVYYVYTPGGYQVVPPPVVYAQSQQVVLQSPAVQAQQPSVTNPAVNATNVTLGNDDTFTVNIPNEKTGGYTEVTLKRTGKGFIGPQGEFYPEFPKVAQLKAMYVK